MKILYITAVSGTMDFFVNTIKKLIEEGHAVDVACSTKRGPLNPIFIKMGCRHYEIDCARNISLRSSVLTVKQIRQIVAIGKYDIVHCHTPIAAACTRFACKGVRRNGLKVVYTAHGFHFYKGAPIKNWLMFYPVEKICSYWTDTLVTITTEDYRFAQKHMKAKRIEYIPGVGIDVDELQNGDYNKQETRESLEISDDDVFILSVGDLNENKNHKVVIEALGRLKRTGVVYAIAGTGTTGDMLLNLAKENNVKLQLLGYRNDVPALMDAADIYIHPSIREGLSVSIQEAMAIGKPVICGRIRGSVDLIDEKGGVLFNPVSVDECERAIRSILDDKILREQMGKYNAEKIEFFSQEKTIAAVSAVYQSLL